MRIVIVVTPKFVTAPFPHGNGKGIVKGISSSSLCLDISDSVDASGVKENTSVILVEQEGILLMLGEVEIEGTLVGEVVGSKVGGGVVGS